MAAASPAAAEQRGVGETMANCCPNCRTSELRSGRPPSFDVTVEQCSTCKGVWLDRGELTALTGHAAADLRIPRGGRLSKRRCPRCRKALMSFYYPQTLVAIEMCGRCDGIWLDKGELNEIKVLLAYARDPKARAAAQPRGVKAALLSFVDNSISALSWW